MTGYFVRRFLLIVPTFIGITFAVFVVMNFVPGGPVERQIMQYKMSMAQRGGRAVDSDIPQDALDEMRRYELAHLTPEQARRDAEIVLSIPGLWRNPNAVCGLVEQQAIFKRFRPK